MGDDARFAAALQMLYDVESDLDIGRLPGPSQQTANATSQDREMRQRLHEMVSVNILGERHDSNIMEESDRLDTTGPVSTQPTFRMPDANKMLLTDDTWRRIERKRDRLLQTRKGKKPSGVAHNVVCECGCEKEEGKMVGLDSISPKHSKVVGLLILYNSGAMRRVRQLAALPLLCPWPNGHHGHSLLLPVSSWRQ
jgi:hypothetical protein